MKKMSLLASALLALGAAACAKQTPVTGPTSAEVQPGVTYQAPPDQPLFTQAWNRIVDGADDIADAGDYMLERTEDGAIRAWRRTERVAGEMKEATEDAALITSVKGRLALDPGVAARDIAVLAQDGNVTLRGKVGSRAEAALAVRLALGTRGVDQVQSYLFWP